MRAVAAGARSEEEFVARLRGEGLVVRPRWDKTHPGQVSGYSVALLGAGNGPLVWFGGGTIGKDLRLPALRAGWGQTAAQRTAAAPVWASSTSLRQKAAAADLAAASQALGRAADLLATQAGDAAGGNALSAQAAGLLAAAAIATPDDRLRRQLVGAWKAVHRLRSTGAPQPIPPRQPATELVMAGDPGRAETPAAGRVHGEPDVYPPVYSGVSAPPGGVGSPVDGLLAGATRVLTASRRSDPSDSRQGRELLLQAVRLAGDLTRLVIAQQEAGEAQRRAAAAVERAALAAAPGSAGQWGFTEDRG